MRKVLLVMLLAVCIAIPAYAVQNRVVRVFNAGNGNTDSTIGLGNGQTSGETYSTAIPIGGVTRFSAWLTLNTPDPGSGLHTPSADVTYEVSYDDTGSNFCTPTTVDGEAINQVVIGRTSTLPTLIQCTPTTAKYIRFRANANGAASTTGTTITLYMMAQE